MTANFPQQTGKESTRQIEKIFVPDGVNGAAIIPKYDLTKDTPQTMIAENNIAIIRLAKTLKIDESKSNFSQKF